MSLSGLLNGGIRKCMDDSIKGIAALPLSLYVNIGEDKNTYFYSGGVFLSVCRMKEVTKCM